MKKKSVFTCIIVTIIFILIEISPTFPENNNFKNNMLRKTNIYVYGKPPLDYLETVGAIGTSWSVYWGGLNSYDLQYVNLLHDKRYKVISNFPTVQGNITNNHTLRENAHCNDLIGNPSIFFGNQYYMCHNHPEWQEFLKSRIKEHIDGKVDAIHIDEIGVIGPFSNGGFCDYCMASFNSYLSKHYSTEDLKIRFGIKDINFFNYRNYLLEEGIKSVWDDPNHNLLKEYLKSQFHSKALKIKELIQYVRDLSDGTILLSGNPYNLHPHQQISIPYLDLVIFEIPIGKLPEGKLFTTYLLGEAIDSSKPFIGFPDIFDLNSISEDDWWLWRHWLAEAFACGSSFLLPYKAYTYSGGEYTISPDKIYPYTKFFKDYSIYYENVSRIAKVGILFDLGSTLSNQVYWRTQLAWEDFLNIGKKLQEAHIPFEVLYNGDDEFINKKLTISDLEKYKIIIIPNYYNLDSKIENLLYQFIFDTGGHVIRIDRLPQESNLVSEIKKIGLDLGLETKAPDDLSIIIYRKENSLLIHLINYRYSYSLHDFEDQNQVTITVTLPKDIDLSEKELILLSPDIEQKMILDYTITGDKITFTVPKIHAYSIVIFRTPPLKLKSPIRNAIYNSCSLINSYQPSFGWENIEPFIKYKVLFSTSVNFLTTIGEVNIKGNQKDWVPSQSFWKKIMMASWNKGDIQPIYWKLIGIKVNGLIEESEVRNFSIGMPKYVYIQFPSNEVSLPTEESLTFDFETNCNTSFKIEISPINDFSDLKKTKRFIYSIKDPNFEKTLHIRLNSNQWALVKKLVEVEKTGYFRIIARDKLNRETISEIKKFILEPSSTEN